MTDEWLLTKIEPAPGARLYRSELMDAGRRAFGILASGRRIVPMFRRLFPTVPVERGNRGRYFADVRLKP